MSPLGLVLLVVGLLVWLVLGAVTLGIVLVVVGVILLVVPVGPYRGWPGGWR